ncbi:MAG: hypothetical protein JWQ96_3076 [Segetibacter sp.]|nr:hypothetical protein [Segetibacter sp.]
MADTTNQQSENKKSDVVLELGDLEVVEQKVPVEPGGDVTSKNENEGVNHEANASNSAMHHAKEGGTGTAGYRDNQRVTTRANEAPDRTDTGSGGLSAGGEKSASQF